MLLSSTQENISDIEPVIHNRRFNMESLNILSDDTTTILQWFLYTALGGAIVLFGIVTNIINVIIFIKQGFKDSVNISLLGLAISDLGCLTTLIWTHICYTPAFRASDLPFDSIEFNYLTSGIPHTVFTRITGWITAFITLERCLCITAPLKVKSIVTPNRVSAIIICIFSVLIVSVVPVYIVNKLDMKYFPDRNKTLIGLTFTANRESVERASYVINNAFLPFTAFIINVVCTVILVVELKRKTKWREKSTNQLQADSVTNKNHKVAKMVVIISTLFIVCFIPVSIMFIAMSLEPELFVNGRYRNILIPLGGFGIGLESINSSVNIFVYYYMSSKYKGQFRELFSSRLLIHNS